MLSVRDKVSYISKEEDTYNAQQEFLSGTCSRPEDDPRRPVVVHLWSATNFGHGQLLFVS
jgi:hypothetical protein